MTVAETSQFLTAVGQLLVGIIAGLSYWQGWRNSSKIEQIHNATNSMKDALVASTATESFARGVKAGSEMNPNPIEPP